MEFEGEYKSTTDRPCTICGKEAYEWHPYVERSNPWIHEAAHLCEDCFHSVFAGEY